MMNAQEGYDSINSLEHVRPEAMLDEVIASALVHAAQHLLDTRKSISMYGIDGAPDWLGFETELWKISERIRRVLTARKDLRHGSAILRAIEKMCREAQYGKGRQNFVLMLGDFGSSDSINVLRGLLGDIDVNGHAIKALTKLKDRSCIQAIKTISENSGGWIRAAAKKYLSKACHLT